MILTEEEAKAKWCPDARVMTLAKRSNGDDESLVGLNRVQLADNAKDLNPTSARCLGSKCMAWRFLDPTRYGADGPLLDKDERRGYCGKVGAP